MPSPVPVTEVLDPVLREILAKAAQGDFERWCAQVRRTGGCTNPIHLVGQATTVHAGTGEILHHYTTAHEPGERLLVACGNRRATRCPACAETYRADTFHLIRAGLTGGKGAPETVTGHPRVFATFTAPSFGPVHLKQRTGRNSGKRLPCHCGTHHADDDPVLGTPVDATGYDYVGAVLWNAHAGALWARFTTLLRRAIARRAGLTQRELSRILRVSFAKVAEYQRRGLIHFHAVIRLDGPEKDEVTPPPAWVTTELLTEAIREAAARTVLRGPRCAIIGRREFRWGEQLDIRPITPFDAGEELTESAVAGYIAKYATKAAETTGTVDWPLYCRRCKGAGLAPLYQTDAHGRRTLADYLDTDCPRCGGTGLAEPIENLRVGEHSRHMIRTCWYLAELPELADLKLRLWAHMLGFRGHFSTKSRTYSTTLGALRSARDEFRAARAREYFGLPDPDTTLVIAHWRFAGAGYTPGESLLAESLCQDTKAKRRTTREEPAWQEGAAPCPSC